MTINDQLDTEPYYTTISEMGELKNSPINEPVAGVPTSAGSVINQDNKTTVSPENITSNSVTNGNLELPKEPSSQVEQNPINIKIEANSPIESQPVSSVINNQNTTDNTQYSELINSGDTISAVSTTLNKIFSQSSLDTLNAALNNNVISNTTTVNPFEATTSNTTVNPFETITAATPVLNSSDFLTTSITNAFDQTTIQKLQSVLNESNSQVTTEKSQLVISPEPKTTTTEIIKTSPSFPEKIAPAIVPAQMIEAKVEKAEATLPEIKVTPSKETESTSTFEKVEKVEKQIQPEYLGLDTSDLEKRMARIEYLLSNTIDVRIVNQ